ncbi:MAG: hypothetical protein V4726_01705 [Verrucomicrobiota bacterium]
MRTADFILGFHGCDAETAERIFSGKDHVTVSSNSHDWLGEGAYFWEKSPGRALAWAETVKRNPQHFKHQIHTPCVVGAVIELGNCLDLMESESLKDLKNSHQILHEQLTRLNMSLPLNEAGFSGDLDLVKRHLDCAVINFTHSLRERENLDPYDTVRGAFPEGRPLYAGARIMESTHVQICVRYPRRSIRGYFRPLPAAG